MSFKNKLAHKIMPSPVDARHYEYSMLFSADDEKAKPTQRLIDLALDSAKVASATSLDEIASRTLPENYLDVWPGEHYKLLAGIIQVMNPKLVIEIGTAKGLSSLSMKKFLAQDAKIITYDIIDWKDYPTGNYLKEEDFQDGRLIQFTDDLSSEEGFKKVKGFACYVLAL